MKEQKSLIRQLNATDAQIEAFIARFEAFLSENLKKILRDLASGKQSADRAAQMLGGLQSALRSAGLGAQLSAIEKIYGTQLSHVNDYLGEVVNKDHVLNDADYTIAETLINFDTKVIANKAYALTDDLSATIMRQVITGETPDVNQLIDDLGSRTVSQIKTELNTATMAFSRSVTQAKAKSLGLKYFLYIGPDDKITRPFCKARVGKVFTLEEIEKWDNGTDLPAKQYLGGYNCRHDLRPVSEERAKELNAD